MDIAKCRYRHVTDEQWAEIGPWVKEQLTAYLELNADADESRLASPLSYAAKDMFVVHGRELDIAEVCDDEVIEDVLNRAQLSGPTKGTYRAALKRLGEDLNPNWAGPRNYVQCEQSTNSSPYNSREMAGVLEWMTTARTPAVAREKELVVALALGAGLRNAEMAQLKWESVFTDEQGSVIHVGQRSVPVDATWAGALVKHRDGQSDSDYVLRPNASYRNPDDIVTRTIGETMNGQVMRPAPRRMRATWIVNMMHRFVPDSVLVYCADLTKLRRYEAFRPEVGPAALVAARGLMHGGRNADSAKRTLRSV